MSSAIIISLHLYTEQHNKDNNCHHYIILNLNLFLRPFNFSCYKLQHCMQQLLILT